jgi:hypothetical protein
MSIIVPHYPRFMDRMQGQTDITLQQDLYHNTRTEKLGAEIKAALASLGQ